jgi:hypothetical protein
MQEVIIRQLKLTTDIDLYSECYYEMMYIYIYIYIYICVCVCACVCVCHVLSIFLQNKILFCNYAFSEASYTQFGGYNDTLANIIFNEINLIYETGVFSFIPVVIFEQK